LLAHDLPALRERTALFNAIMYGPGGVRRADRKLASVAVSLVNGCVYCTASHGTAAKRLGMSPEMLGELIAVVGMANETNRLADGYRVPVDERFENLF